MARLAGLLFPFPKAMRLKSKPFERGLLRRQVQILVIHYLIKTTVYLNGHFLKFFWGLRPKPPKL